ncbi:MAG: adenylosuccinate synthase [Bacteroidota bacterium]|nr:adenylosuccinate synthase [Bacteroidota bacterium]
MKVDILLGLQWGDEGKGKIVDFLGKKYNLIGRFQGGPNAGHTIKFNGLTNVLHTIPSGIFQKKTKNLIGNGVVIDPIIFFNELEKLKKNKIFYKNNLFISRKAHLILPTHRYLDAASELAKGKKKVGSTLKGIGPTYMDKTGRNGLRVGDIESKNFIKKFKTLTKKHNEILLKLYNYKAPNQLEDEKIWLQCVKELKKLNIVDGEYFVNNKEIKRILAEGAQGTLLDIDYGSYPYVTSSNTVAAGACTGLGIPPNKIKKVIGIFKAYCTRVGSGPFTTELHDNIGKEIQKIGHEFGSTTGRSRRCGWLDLPALKYATMINGITELVITKIDVLSSLEKIKVCTHYKYFGKKINHLPYDLDPKEIKPIYKEFKGWEKDITKISNFEHLPLNLKNYIKYLEKEINIPIKIISVGPDRNETIYR